MHAHLCTHCAACSPPHAAASIFRTATSRYTTAEQSTLEDLKCQICLTTLRQCVALEPCGHNFCACCLSHHLGNQLQSGLQLSCPFRCGAAARMQAAAEQLQFMWKREEQFRLPCDGIVQHADVWRAEAALRFEVDKSACCVVFQMCRHIQYN